MRLTQGSYSSQVDPLLLLDPGNSGGLPTIPAALFLSSGKRSKAAPSTRIAPAIHPGVLDEGIVLSLKRKRVSSSRSCSEARDSALGLAYVDVYTIKDFRYVDLHFFLKFPRDRT